MFLLQSVLFSLSHEWCVLWGFIPFLSTTFSTTYYTTHTSSVESLEHIMNPSAVKSVPKTSPKEASKDCFVMYVFLGKNLVVNIVDVSLELLETTYANRLHLLCPKSLNLHCNSHVLRDHLSYETTFFSVP